MAYFIYNDSFYKDPATITGPANRGLRYGDGVFETMKIQEGKIFLEDLHFARLWKGMNTLGFEIPRLFTPEKLSEKIHLLAKKNGHEKNARVRLQVFRGEGGLYDNISHQPNYAIETWELPATNRLLNSNGLELGIYHDTRKSCDILSNLKHSNYLVYVMAALHVKKQKWNDALILNQYERICDSTIANVFIIKNETVYTPALSEGCVAGTMREHLIQHLKSTAWKVAETSLTETDILNADEVFLTNSVYGIRWVKLIGKSEYGNRITQKIYTILFPPVV